MNSTPTSQPALLNSAHARLDGLRDQIATVAAEMSITADSVRIVGAAKAQSIDTIRSFLEAGLAAIGENYLQEAQQKSTLLGDFDVEWHFIGRVQSNKAKIVAQQFDWVQTVDSVRLARRLSDARLAVNPEAPLDCCVQINADAEPQKAGVLPEDMDDLISEVGRLPGITLRGIMAIPVPNPDIRERIATFKRIKTHFDNASPRQPEHWDTLSMGMSDDFLAAIRCGANLVRLGTSLFGPRPPK